MVDKLKPEVRDAVGRMDQARAAGDIGEPFYARHEDYDTIRAELMRLAEENARLVTDADDQREATGDLVSRLERAESALAELRAKVESAPVGVYAATAADHGVVHTHRWIAADLIGKRVRLLLDNDAQRRTPRRTDPRAGIRQARIMGLPCGRDGADAEMGG